MLLSNWHPYGKPRAQLLAVKVLVRWLRKEYRDCLETEVFMCLRLFLVWRALWLVHLKLVPSMFSNQSGANMFFLTNQKQTCFLNQSGENICPIINSCILNCSQAWRFAFDFRKMVAVNHDKGSGMSSIFCTKTFACPVMYSAWWP